MILVRLANKLEPTDIVEAVKFTPENGAVIARHWLGLMYHVEEQVITRHGETDEIEPGTWFFSHPGSERAYLADEDILFGVYQSVVTVTT